jgi:hypothetical protein
MHVLLWTSQRSTIDFSDPMTSPEQALSALLVMRRDALLAKHAEALTQLLHPNYVYINSVGTMLGREEYVKFYCGSDDRSSGGQGKASVTIRDMDMREVFFAMIDGTGFLVIHTHETFEFEGKVYEQDYRVQHVVLPAPDGTADGTWLFASGQSTPIL